MLANQFIHCTPVSLPEDQILAAMHTAIQENPVNRVPMECLADPDLLTPGHLAVMTSKYWGSKGVKLTVGFMEQTPFDLQKRILAHMNAWSTVAGANVEFTIAPDAQVRITRSGDGYWSYLGTDILHIPRGQPTMCLQAFTMNTPESEFVRVVRHETGHSLGMPHEHMRRELVARIDPQKAIAYFGRTQGWTPRMVQSQVLDPLEESSLLRTPNANPADQTSIMCYQLPGDITFDGLPIIGGVDINENDAEFARTVYPRASEPTNPIKPNPPTPPPSVSGDVAFHLDLGRKTAVVSVPGDWSVKRAI